MAIQIRRGSNAEWETNNSNIVVGEPAVATDSKRAFIGTASGAYMELANLEAIAPAYDPGNSYMIDDYVSYQGKLYVCTVPTSGVWNASAWQVTSLGQALAENAYSNYETYTMSGNIVSFPNGAGGIPVKDLKVDIEAVQSGSGDPSPTNVRPIVGWDEVNVNVTGKNLWHINDATVTSNGVTFTSVNGIITANGTATGADAIMGVNAGVVTEPNQPYTISGCPSGGSATTYFFQQNYYNGSAQAGAQDFGNGQTFIPRNDTVYQSYIVIKAGVTVNNLVFKPMVEKGSTKSQYEPYNGQTYTTDLNGTRYGGTLDVATGVLTVTWKQRTFTGADSYSFDANGVYIRINEMLKALDYSDLIKCDKLKTIVQHNSTWVDYSITGFRDANNRYPAENWIYFKVPNISNTSEFITWLNSVGGLDVIYELATPQTVQLTPTQVRTLLGQNNIWCDSGEIEELTYRISNVQ